MTKDESAVKPDAKESSKSRDKPARQRGQKRDKLKAPTKIIIRHLPPTMTEEEFLKQIDPLPPHDFYYYAAADWSLGFDATCRAYLTLKDYEDVFLFRDRFDGYVFVDSKGAEYVAIVEFAPFQGLLKNKSRRSDNKVNTIEEESHYQQFLVKLEEDREAAAKGGEVKLEFSLGKKEEKITSTPLLQYLALKKEKRREEAKRRSEEKRRQRDEEKEKKRQPQVTKIITSHDGNAGKKSDGSKTNTTGNKDNASGDAGKDGGENRMNSRAKRRAERDKRRREEHEQRKREREQAEKASKNSEKSAEISQGADKTTENEKSQRKDESKPRRDRNRDRNRNRNRDKDKEKDKERFDKGKDKEKYSNIPKGEEIKPLKVVEILKSSNAAASDEISESVKSFIRSVAHVKEFIPKNKQQLQENETELEKHETPMENQDQVQQLNEKLDDMTINDANTQLKPEISAEGEDKSEAANFAQMDEKTLQRQRSAEERRIRNKDRPSIAIYQPKPRLRCSEESDTNASKDVRSNPTSDCESVKKEDQRKKVSRYSERRGTVEKRSKEKSQKSNEFESETVNIPQQNHELRKSVSCESSNELKDANSNEDSKTSEQKSSESQ